MNFNFTKDAGSLPDPRFVPLGTATEDPKKLKEKTTIFQKIGRLFHHSVDEVWGTIGWENNAPFNPEGELHFSGNGNVDEGFRPGTGETHQLTQQEISDLKEINPDLDFDPEKKQVRERYINFDDMHFELPEVFDPRYLPRLRLTLFLEPDEGAIVYYQHGEEGNPLDEHAVLEYILYQHEQTPERDRLTYLFPIEPKHKLVPVDEEKHLYRESEERTGMSFTIKILTFRQKRGTEQEIFDRQTKELNGLQLRKVNLKKLIAPGHVVYELVGKDKYDLLVFNPASTKDHPGGGFVSVGQKSQLNENGKTLLLIHGTFVNTDKSFKDLLLPRDNGNSYLQELLQTGKFTQIIALNHPTISHDAEQNVSWLQDRLNELDLYFREPVQIITTSRGALVAEYMASDPEIAQRIPVIAKIMMFSAGNGCGYFKLGDKISTILSMWRKTASGPAGKIVLSIAQLSVDWFLKQPGCVLMNENKPVLASILDKSPVNPHIQYKTVASDWHNCLNSAVDTNGNDIHLEWYNRLKNTSLDALIKIALGNKHDWVIGFERQKVIPKNSNTALLEERHSVHGRYLERNYVRQIVDPEHCAVMPDPHKTIAEFFD